MTILDFLLLLLVAAICGAIAQALVGVSVGGCLVSAIVGFIGALIGLWLARELSLPEVLTIHIGNQSFPVYGPLSVRHCFSSLFRSSPADGEGSISLFAFILSRIRKKELRNENQ